jgi:uncharacterized protein YjbJ (UPF0337 family)
MSNKAEDLKGRAKEAVGAATDDESMRREGKVDQASAGIKDRVEDAVDTVKEKIEGATDRS